MRVPRRTARLRLTVLYGAAFLVCGAAVLAVVTYLVFGRANISQPGNTASAEFSGRVPAAVVHRAGANDIIPIPVPAYDVQQSAGTTSSISARRNPSLASPPLRRRSCFPRRRCASPTTSGRS